MSPHIQLGLVVCAIAVVSAAACKDDTAPTPTVPTFTTTLLSSLEVPPVTSNATGNATITVDATKKLTYTVTFSGLTTGLTGAHIHMPAAPGANAGVVVPFTITSGVTAGTIGPTTVDLTTSLTGAINADSAIKLLNAGQAYVNLHTSQNPGGEIRGWLAKK